MTSGWRLVRFVGFLLADTPYGNIVAFMYSQGMLPMSTVYWEVVRIVGCVFCVLFSGNM